MLTNQISNSARLMTVITSALANGVKTVNELYEIPRVNEIAKSSRSVGDVLKNLHATGIVRKLPHFDKSNLHVKYAYELVNKPIVERRQVPESVITQVNNLFDKPSITISNQKLIIELENFKITIEG